MKKEAITTTPIYAGDYEKLKKFRDEKNLGTMKEAVRVVVEYAQAHGVFA